MCLIILAQSGTNKKSDFLQAAIRKAAITNDDGIGYMYKKDGLIHVDKGYKDVEEFIKVLLANDILTFDTSLAIHLRIGNRGAVNQEMCHPFVCSSDPETVTASEIITDEPTLMHNGTFMGLTLPFGKSDTYVFTHKFMSDPDINGLFKNNTTLFQEIFKSVLSVSRVLVFYPKDDIDFVKIGTWVEQDGYFFSNETFQNSNIKDVGGKVIQVGSKAANATPSNRRISRYTRSKTTDPIPSERMQHIPTDTNFNYPIRNTRTDSLKELVLDSQKNDTFTDEIGYECATYCGLIGYLDKPYITDEISFELRANKYNYRYLTLQAKENIDYYGIRENVYYKIMSIITNPNNGQSLATVVQQVGINSTPSYVPMENINEIFSVSSSNYPLANSLHKAYLDAVASLNTHNKYIKKLVKMIGKENDMKVFTIPTKGGKNTLYLPVIVIKWFLYELKIHQGASDKRIKQLLTF